LASGLDFAEQRYVENIFPAEYNYWLAVRRGLLQYDPALDVEARPDNEYWKSEAYRIMHEDVYGQPGGVFSLH
jgi:hypothetical protein